jgi:hypothetical protein
LNHREVFARFGLLSESKMPNLTGMPEIRP